MWREWVRVWTSVGVLRRNRTVDGPIGSGAVCAVVRETRPSLGRMAVIGVEREKVRHLKQNRVDFGFRG